MQVTQDNGIVHKEDSLSEKAGMPQLGDASLWQIIRSAGNLSKRFIWEAGASVNLGDLVCKTSLCGGTDKLRGRSALVKTRSQLAAGLALIELDGVARRIVLCPSDLPSKHLQFVIDTAEVDAIVSDENTIEGNYPGAPAVSSSLSLVRTDGDRNSGLQTEWVLLTSGTTGKPKMLVHSLQSFAGSILGFSKASDSEVWSTFYDIRRYGGLILFLRALSTGGSIVLSSGNESVTDFLRRAEAHGVTHLTGSPSLWRRALMSPAASLISPSQVRLSGEVIDQAILDRLHVFYPQANITHAFASTEAGLAFGVTDGLAGFPAGFIGKRDGNVELKIEDGSLRIRSPRTALRYLGPQVLKDGAGFVDTGDMVELRGDRYYFVGRRDGIINVGGFKFYPEEVEAVINQHPNVRMALVRKKKSSITGSLVVADVILENELDRSPCLDGIQHDILLFCRSLLPRYKVPAVINVVSELPITVTGKMARHDT